MKDINLKATIYIITFVLTGCAAQPAINTQNIDQRSFDGLYPIDHTRVDRAWARADLDLSGYTQIKLEGAGIQYRPTRERARTLLSGVRNNDSDFPVSAKNRDRLRELVRSEFTRELQKLEHYTLTDASGPNVLIVRGALLDVVSNVPFERPVRSEIYLQSVGEATLMLELIDSETHAVLVRAIDRRTAGRDDFMFESNQVTNWVEVKRLARHWARLLRTRLDELTTTLTISDPG